MHSGTFAYTHKLYFLADRGYEVLLDGITLPGSGTKYKRWGWGLEEAGAVDALERLKAADKRVLILSNAPRRIAPVIARMRRLGIADGLYDAVLSSGEAAWPGLPEAIRRAVLALIDAGGK